MIAYYGKCVLPPVVLFTVEAAMTRMCSCKVSAKFCAIYVGILTANSFLYCFEL